MTKKLPVISGQATIKAFQKIGYQVTRQRGSHVRLLDRSNPLHEPLSIPDHDPLKPGLLRKLIRDANITIDEFRNLL